jgi:hypothetical protein
MYSHNLAYIDCPVCFEERRIKPCSQCARFREKIDRGKMADIIAGGMAMRDEWGYPRAQLLTADALIKYLTE